MRLDLKTLLQRKVSLMTSKDSEYIITDPIDPALLPEPYEFDSAKSLLASLNKYDPDQPRDESGRFGSGGGGGSSEGDSNTSSNNGKENYGGYTLNSIPNIPAKETRSPEAVAAARAELERDLAEEPENTRNLIDAANDSGMKMEGLDFRAKSEDSLARKIDAEKDLPENGGDAAKAAESMSDTVRYTMTAEGSDYKSSIEGVLKDLEGKGYESRVKNYWLEENPYRGINVALTTPSGNMIELQFHTPESLEVKEPLHQRYDVYRESADPIERQALYDEMVSMAQAVPTPPNVQEIGTLKPMPFSPTKAIKRGRVANGEDISNEILRNSP